MKRWERQSVGVGRLLASVGDGREGGPLTNLHKLEGEVVLLQGEKELSKEKVYEEKCVGKLK